MIYRNKINVIDFVENILYFFIYSCKKNSVKDREKQYEENQVMNIVGERVAADIFHGKLDDWYKIF